MQTKRIEKFIAKVYEKGLPKNMPLDTFRSIEFGFNYLKQYGIYETLKGDVMLFFEKYGLKSAPSGIGFKLSVK